MSLYAAGLSPELASLTVLEPPAFGLVAGDPAADELAGRVTAHWEQGDQNPRDFLLGFYAVAQAARWRFPIPSTPNWIRAPER